MSAQLAVYKSSAGSGKTYTLVKSYLQIILESPDSFRNILALTFTNKAAFEMKSRIILYLNHLAHPATFADSPSVTQLLPELSTTLKLSESVLSERAQTCLRNILFQYSDFAVSTLDSFFNRVVKAFALDLHVPMNYEIDLDEIRIQNEATQRLIARVGLEHDSDLTELLCNYTHEKICNEKSSTIEKDFDSIAAVVRTEQALKYLPKIRDLNILDFSVLESALANEHDADHQALTEIGQNILDFLNQNGLSPEDFFQGKRGIYKSWHDASKGIIPEFNSYAHKSIEEDKWSSKTQAAEIHISRIKLLTQTLVDWVDEHKPVALLRDQIRKQLTGIAVLSQIERHIFEIKEQTGILSISDLGKHISKIVSEESAPFIYQRIGERYKHFFIDEFQDTSILQWQNLLPLIDNSLSEGYYNLIVGDAKQAIYRFRNGEVEQFTQLPKLFPTPTTLLSREREQSLISNYQEFILSCNYRSRQRIVAFNNDLYGFLQTQLPERFRGIYDNQAQSALPNRKGGYIELQIVESADSQSYKEQTYDFLRSGINDLIERGYSYRDMAILVTGNKYAPEISQVLIESEIPVLSTESLLLSSSPEVRLLIATLRCILNPKDEVSALGVVNICKDNTVILAHTLQIQKTYLDRWEGLPFYDLCEDILRCFYDQALHNNAYIQSLLNFIYQKSQEHLSIADFLKAWDDKGESLSIGMPDGLDAVQVLTIHKSKGLEFPIVFLPFLDAQASMSRRYIWAESPLDLHPELKVAYLRANEILQETPIAEVYQEERDKVVLDLANLLYVASTRAEQGLFISCKTPSKQESFSMGHLLNTFALSRVETPEGPTRFDKGYFWGDIETLSSNASRISNVDKEAPLSISSSGRWQKTLTIERVRNLPHASTARGIEIHEALSKLHEGDKNPITQMVMNHPELRPYFESPFERAVETELINKEGHILRPDLVIFGVDETLLIDYKTGQAHEKHQGQMAAYAEALKDMGYHNISGILVYIGEEISLLKLLF